MVTGLLLGWLVAGVGCATTIHPPVQLSNPVAVHLVDYGRHSCLMLPHEDGGVMEYAYGEWQWYALNRQQPWDVLRALFVPTRGALGRRHHDLESGAVESGDIEIERAFVIHVEANAVRALRDELDRQWDTAASTVVVNPTTGLAFVYAEESYWLFNNCNPVTARWLESLGCEVRGWAILSDWHIGELRPP